MRITEIELKGFGKFQNKSITFAPGLNVIHGTNEAGKSTVHAFIRAMLFGLERTRGRVGKDDRYRKYLPWESGAAYGGSMDLELDGKRYRILRNFHQNQKSVSCICLDTGREVLLPTGQITDLIPTLTESLYRNTVSMEQQKARTDSELAGQVHNYITNIAAAGSGEVDVKLAVTTLQEKRKLAENALKDLEEKLQTVTRAIEDGRESEVRMERLLRRQQELLAVQSDLTRRLGELKGEITRRYGSSLEQLPAVQEKYRASQELLCQAEQYREKEQQLREAAAAAEKGKAECEKQGRSLEELSGLTAARREAENQKREILAKQREEEAAVQDDHKRRSAVIVGFGLIVTIACLLMKDIPGNYLGIYGGVLLALTGGMVYLVSEKKARKRKRPYEEDIEELEQQVLRCESRRHEILLDYNVLDERDLRAKYEAGLRRSAQGGQLAEQAEWYSGQRQQLEQRVKKNREEIAAYASRFLKKPGSEEGPGGEWNAEYMERLAKQVAECREENRRRLEACQEERAECELHLEKLKWELDRGKDNGERLAEQEERFRELTEQRGRKKEELAAIRLAISTIEDLSARIHDNFGGRFGQDVSEFVCRYTGGRHEKAYLDEKLNMRISSGRDFVPLESLSTGTIEQVYLALRLTAGARLIGREDIPILLDDSFAYYDDERLKTVLADLARGPAQVLLFTCQSREERMLRELGWEYRATEL
ncbi:MAG: AAA family ATPase [Lachnospiraceae bacterium]|nr:AAA family ATPase [Lachnospiraceae bacterium]